MKKLTLSTIILSLILAFNSNVNAQGFEPGDGFRQLNFGIGTSGWGIALYGGMDFGIAEKLTIGPWVGLRTKSDVTAYTAGFRSDYHYGGHISGLPRELDLYGGLGIGYTNVTIDNGDYDPVTNTFDDSNDGYVDIWFRAGARWYFSPQWGVMGEVIGVSRGDLSAGTIGLSYKF